MKKRVLLVPFGILALVAAAYFWQVTHPAPPPGGHWATPAEARAHLDPRWLEPTAADEAAERRWSATRQARIKAGLPPGPLDAFYTRH